MGKKKKEEQNIQILTGELIKPIGQLFEEAYLSYGNYINNFRAIAHIVDGLKISYIRFNELILCVEKTENS